MVAAVHGRLNTVTGAREQAPLEVTVVRGPQGLQAIASEWAEVAQQLGRRRFFHWYAWFCSYLSALDPDPAAVYFFVLRAGSRPVAIVPLKLERQRQSGIAVHVLTLPPHVHLPLRDVLCVADVAASDVVESLLRCLREQRLRWDMIRFADVMQESPLAALRSDGGWRVLVRRAKTCDYVVCDRPFETITRTFSRNFRSNLTKARNKLAQEAGVEFESVSQPGPDMQRCFAEFLEVEASGWKGNAGSGTAIKLHPELLHFYASLIDNLAAADAVVINCLRAGGAPIAAQFCLRDADTLYVLKLAYDERHARLAPGNMLLERVIGAGCASGMFRHVNLVGDPPWFKDWQPLEVPVYTIELYNTTAAGLTLLAGKRAKRRLRSMRDRYRLRRADHS
jgi:CelD/BcsL family acetyltransferase involved in cellulose biosynthesis